MAMLAEPRRRQKIINLRAKNNAWSNDANKFGQKMLEKMGWSAGKGLGAKENGIVEHVVARYKNDDKGLGFEDKNDQWTKHEDDFNALLANLSNGDSNEEKLHSGISLENKSKKSKARVHYHKFTRGKDLSRYSEKDLANIFGKKSFKNEVTVEEVNKKDIKITEQVFTEKGSMEDYFKNKLATLKSKVISQPPDDFANDTDNFDHAFKGFSDTNYHNSHEGNGFQQFSFYNADDNKPDNNTEAKCRKKNKKTKFKEKIEGSDIVVDDGISFTDNIMKEKCRKNNKKRKLKEETECGDSNIKKDITLSDGVLKKKKNKRRECGNEIILDSLEQPVKKKSKKRKQERLLEIQIAVQENLTADQEIHVPKKKKKRKQFLN